MICPTNECVAFFSHCSERTISMIHIGTSTTYRSSFFRVGSNIDNAIFAMHCSHKKTIAAVLCPHVGAVVIIDVEGPGTARVARVERTRPVVAPAAKARIESIRQEETVAVRGSK